MRYCSPLSPDTLLAIPLLWLVIVRPSLKAKRWPSPGEGLSQKHLCWASSTLLLHLEFLSINYPLSNHYIKPSLSNPSGLKNPQVSSTENKTAKLPWSLHSITLPPATFWLSFSRAQLTPQPASWFLPQGHRNSTSQSHHWHSVTKSNSCFLALILITIYVSWNSFSS